MKASVLHEPWRNIFVPAHFKMLLTKVHHSCNTYVSSREWHQLLQTNRPYLKIILFWDITSCSPLKVNRRFEGTCRLCLPPAFTLVYCSAYPSTLKMEAICSSETSVDFQLTARSYIPEDNSLQKHNQFPIRCVVSMKPSL
jgi:hypothetical protein